MILAEASRLHALDEYYFSQKLREIEAMSKKGKPVLNLGIGNPDLPPAGSTIKRLTDSLNSEGNHGYQGYRSIHALRNAFSRWYQTYYNVRLHPEDEILPLMGSKEGIFFISMAFLNPGDAVLVPDPGYPTYAAATKLAGGMVRTYPLHRENGWYPNLDDLEKERS